MYRCLVSYLLVAVLVSDSQLWKNRTFSWPSPSRESSSPSSRVFRDWVRAPELDASHQDSEDHPRETSVTPTLPAPPQDSSDSSFLPRLFSAIGAGTERSGVVIDADERPETAIEPLSPSAAAVAREPPATGPTTPGIAYLTPDPGTVSATPWAVGGWNPAARPLLAPPVQFMTPADVTSVSLLAAEVSEVILVVSTPKMSEITEKYPTSEGRAGASSWDTADVTPTAVGLDLSSSILASAEGSSRSLDVEDESVNIIIEVVFISVSLVFSAGFLIVAFVS